MHSFYAIVIISGERFHCSATEIIESYEVGVFHSDIQPMPARGTASRCRWPCCRTTYVSDNSADRESKGLLDPR